MSTNVESAVKEEQEELDEADGSSTCRGDTTGICQINDHVLPQKLFSLPAFFGTSSYRLFFER